MDKETPAQAEAFRRVIETARALVSCADEFPDDPGACSEYLDAHQSALETWGKVWDEEDEERRLAILKEASDRAAYNRSMEAWVHNS